MGRPYVGRPIRRCVSLSLRVSVAVTLVTLVALSVTHHGSKFLNASTRDCFCDVEVAFRIGGRRVSECEMAAVMARAWYYAADSQSSEHRRGCLVNEPSVVVAKIDID